MDTPETMDIDFRRTCPWLHLFRGFRIALDLRSLLLGGLGVLALLAGEATLELLPFTAESDYVEREAAIAFDQPLRVPRDVDSVLFDLRLGWSNFTRPLRAVVKPVVDLFGFGIGWGRGVETWLRLMWALVVWSLVGCGVARIAAVRFARDQSVTFRDSVSLAVRRLPSCVGGAGLPIFGIGFVWLVCAVGGLAGRIPVAGPFFVAVFWFVPLVLGFVVLLMLLGALVGWPLLPASVATEESGDGFLGFSRSYSYVYGHPLYAAWLFLVSLVLGVLGTVLVYGAATFVVYAAAWATAAGAGPETMRKLLGDGPEALGFVARADATSASRVLGAWTWLVAVLTSGFGAAYFWTLATIVYLLLRAKDDGKDLTDVYVPEDDEEDELLPLVGVAAGEGPVEEREIGQVPQQQNASEATTADGETPA